MARRIISQLRDEEPTSTYDGRGICYMEVGHDQVAKVDVTFMAGQRPSGELEGPDVALAADKSEFGTSRIGRWFGA